MAIEGWIQAPADGTGKKLGTDHVTTSGGTVIHREFVRLVASTRGTFSEVLKGDPSTTEAGLIVRQTPTGIRYKVVSGTTASFLANVTVLGTKRVQSDTAASFLVTMPGAKTVLSPTAASFNITMPGAKTVLSPTAASFNVTIPGAKNVLSLTAASFNVTALNLATARSTWPTIETNNTNATVISDLSRRLIVSPWSFPEKTQSTSITVTSVTPIALFNATSGERNYITCLMGSNSSGTATRVDVFDRNTAGKRFASAYVAASGGGFVLPCPVPCRGNSNSTVVVRVTPTVTSVFVTAGGYSAP